MRNNLFYTQNYSKLHFLSYAQIIPNEFLDKRFIRPKHYNIANAYGAALAEISGVISRIIRLDKDPEKKLQTLESEVKKIAIANGSKRHKIRLIEKNYCRYFICRIT
ncbi:MAG TPA: hypothetical protein VGH95_04345 [Candidatus Aquirickettsiella sp.]|jgi:N-methylhydantoinase A/oxoprolinase/acetone carboxylase beta subunit